NLARIKACYEKGDATLQNRELDKRLLTAYSLCVSGGLVPAYSSIDRETFVFLHALQNPKRHQLNTETRTHTIHRSHFLGYILLWTGVWVGLGVLGAQEYQR